MFLNIVFGLLSILVLVGIGFLLSENKKAIQWRPIILGILLQIVLLVFLIKVPIGIDILDSISDGVDKVISFGNSGLNFVFGKSLNTPEVFAISVLGIVCFVTALINVLYYLRIIPLFIKTVGRILAKIFGVSDAEMFCAVSNMFLGGSEAPMVVKPFLNKMTRSQLFCITVGGFSSVSTGVLAGYVGMGIPLHYLLLGVATVPFSTVVMAKLLVPETENVNKRVEIAYSDENGLFEAISNGAITGMEIGLKVGAILIAVLGLVAFINYILKFFNLSLTEIFGWILLPLAKLMHIPVAEQNTYASLIGLKIATNEFVAFGQLGKVLTTLSVRTQAMLVVALVNFANLSVIGITIGSMKVFASERSKEVSGFVFKSMIAGILTTLITSAIIGMIY